MSVKKLKAQNLEIVHTHHPFKKCQISSQKCPQNNYKKRDVQCHHLGIRQITPVKVLETIKGLRLVISTAVNEYQLPSKQHHGFTLCIKNQSLWFLQQEA